MENKINWETDIRQALKRARDENKPVMLDFFNLESLGCQEMDVVTYKNEKIVDFINRKVIPLRVNSNQQLATDFHIEWTPALIILDQNKREQYRSIGFLSVDEFIPTMLLGICNAFSSSNEFIMALGCYEKILIDYPASDVAPEAVFKRGVNLYKKSHDLRPLNEAYTHLQKNYPTSAWTKRAYPYRFLS